MRFPVSNSTRFIRPGRDARAVARTPTGARIFRPRPVASRRGRWPRHSIGFAFASRRPDY